MSLVRHRAHQSGEISNLEVPYKNIVWINFIMLFYELFRFAGGQIFSGLLQFWLNDAELNWLYKNDHFGLNGKLYYSARNAQWNVLFNVFYEYKSVKRIFHNRCYYYYYSNDELFSRIKYAFCILCCRVKINNNCIFLSFGHKHISAIHWFHIICRYEFVTLYDNYENISCRRYRSQKVCSQYILIYWYLLIYLKTIWISDIMIFT